MFRALARHEVEYVTIGGVAIQAYGGQRMTQDLADMRLLESVGDEPDAERQEPPRVTRRRAGYGDPMPTDEQTREQIDALEQERLVLPGARGGELTPTQAADVGAA